MLGTEQCRDVTDEDYLYILTATARLLQSPLNEIQIHIKSQIESPVQ
jgi:hypothetical protein